jgi:hypothetical protein
MGLDRPHSGAQPGCRHGLVSAGTEVGFCPRCQATRTLRSVETVAFLRSAAGMRLVRRRQRECVSCDTFLSMVEMPVHTEVVAGSS